MDPNTLVLLLRANVLRFGSHPDARLRGQDAIQQHSARMALLCLWLNPQPSATLLREIMFHDLPEVLMGDWPASVTRAFPPLAPAKRAAEGMARDALELPAAPLTEREQVWLKFLDLLDAILFMLDRAPDLLTRRTDWQDDLKTTLGRAEALGGTTLVQAVHALIGAAR